MSVLSLISLLIHPSLSFDDDLELDFPEEEVEEPLLQNLSVQEPLLQKPNFYMEITMLCLICLYISNVYIGKQKNERLATGWLYLLKPLFQENFSMTGVAEKEGDGEMLKEANHVFKYYASGRYNMGYILGTLELLKRQDLFNTLFISPFSKEQDKVSYEIPIKQENPNPIAFMLCRTNQVKNIRANHNDIKTLTSAIDVGLPSGYTLLAESSEAAEFLFNTNVIRLIESLSNSIEMVYVTDQVNLIQSYPITLVSSFVYPKDGKDVDFVATQAQLVITLADLTSKLALSGKVKAAAEKERATMNKEKVKEINQQREEERLQKKYDQKKKEEEKMQGLSKEKKRKLEEKEYKKELKKKGLKFKMVKG
ncbi:hypothetical protein SteCoe_14003 [Stentor coeruleus]|uniref:DUF1682 domain-containing protein n=1 Tax=Stentor coeruleus TaxID=5963 RepID=A0A1R2C7A5_9CILI|nr:hypothetical protein SteCoe_14003 [Stentor coeruleus]